MLAPGTVQVSPFVHREGSLAVETVSGSSYRLNGDERALFDACASPRDVASLGSSEQALAQSLLDRLLLVDDGKLRAIGAATLGQLDLEAAGSCNAECIFCPREELRHGRGLGVMKEETFARVLALFAPFLRFVGFAGIGEPTLNKALPRFVRALTERRIEVALVTNGSLLDEALAGELLGAGVSSVQVSFNGNVRASYEEHMLGLDFEETKARLERFLPLARARGVPVYISAIETTKNGAELAGFVEHWQALGAIAHVVPCHSRGGTIVALQPRPPRRDPAPAARCGLFNTRTFVSWDGRVLACCHDVDGKTELGHVTVDDASTLIARKLEIMRRREWYAVCAACDEPARLARVAPESLR